MSIKTIVVLALLPLALTGCGGSTPAAAPAPAATVTATSTPTPAPTPTPEAETPEEDLGNQCIDEPDALLVSEGWVLADASRGESDHQIYVTKFAEDTSKLSKDAQDQCPPGDLMVSVAKLALDAAILNGQVLAADGDEGDSQTYSDIKADGKDFFHYAGVTDHKFGRSLFDE